jgi:hypothetical protein
MTTDYRALCAELLDGIELDVAHVEDPDRFRALLARARTALAQPEPTPKELTDADLWQIWKDTDGSIPTVLRAAIAAGRARFTTTTNTP